MRKPQNKEQRTKQRTAKKKRVKQYSKVGIEIQKDRPERRYTFPGEQAATPS